MRSHSSRGRVYRAPIKGLALRNRGRNSGILPGVMLFAAAAVAVPLAFVLDRLVGAGWLFSITGAVAIVAILAAGLFALIDK